MRPDGRPEALRQAMSWLHTWSGLLLGWLLYAVFFTGTLSYFLDEINVWMKPELHRSVPAAPEVSAERALQTMQRIAPDATNWTIELPGERQVAVEASWREPGAAAGRAGIKRAELDATTGEKIDTRETRGGGFLYRFHFELYAMPREWARWIVGIATMAMLVAIISGVITHKKIFTEFFTFRRGRGQRSWLDAHNATAVLALPFHFVITASGLLLLMFMLMPWGVQTAYDGNTQTFMAERRGQMMGGGGPMQQPAPDAQKAERAAGAPAADAPQAAPQGGAMQAARTDRAARAGPPDRSGGDERAGGNGGGERDGRAPRAGREGAAARDGHSSRGDGAGDEGAPGRRPRGGAAPEETTALADLRPMLALAAQRWPERGIGSIAVSQPGTARATIELREAGSGTLLRRGGERLTFDGVTGALRDPTPAAEPGLGSRIFSVFTAIHLGRFAGPAMRWLLFLAGVTGTLMVATGLVLWVVKRLPDRRKLGYTPRGHRLVEVLNVGGIAGLSLATAGYFWLNRLVPASLAGRTDWEIHGFFIVWALALAHTALRPHRRAWIEQLTLAAAMFALLPLLNPLTGGSGLWRSLPAGQWPIAGFDLVMLALALVHGYAARRLTKTAAAPAGRVHGQPAAARAAVGDAALAGDA